MKVFVAGATGAIGLPLVRQLTERGHQVVGTTRTSAKEDLLRTAGAEPALVDALDRDAVVSAVAKAAPDAIVHQMTALSGADFRRFEKSFQLTNRLRTEGTDNLLAAARDSGVRRFVAQSFAGWPYERRGGWVKSEDDPLDPDPAPQGRTTVDAARYLESAVTGAGGIDGIVLRYGGFYGPGSGMEPGGEQVEMIRKRRYPIVGKGTGVWSFVHVEDAAAATVAAVERGAPGIYNVVDDEPARVAEWLPYLAELAGAKAPMRLPAWLGRLAGGRQLVVLMNESRGASNAKAKRELQWSPRRSSWREGFREVLSA